MAKKRKHPKRAERSDTTRTVVPTVELDSDVYKVAGPTKPYKGSLTAEPNTGSRKKREKRKPYKSYSQRVA